MTIKDIGLKNLIIILICGIFLIVISVSELFVDKKDKEVPILNKAEEENNVSKDAYIEKMENKLENLLEKTSGAGDVQVMLTVESMNEQVVLKDIPADSEEMSETDSSGVSMQNKISSNEENTVIFEDSDGNMMSYIIKELEPTITGVVIIAEGGDNIAVQNEIIGAVQVLFDIPIHKIKVMKMNNENINE